jgi:cytochrome c oxidase subunit IV
MSLAHEHRAHSSSPYFAVFAALLALTGTTVLVAFLPLGEWHAAMALGIAAIKASLIILIFMHARESDQLTWLVILTALLFLAILLGGVYFDYGVRPADREIRQEKPLAGHLSAQLPMYFA